MERAIQQRQKGGFPENEFLHSANAYLKPHRRNTIMRKGNFHSYGRIRVNEGTIKVRRKVSFLKRLLHTLIG